MEEIIYAIKGREVELKDGSKVFVSLVENTTTISFQKEDNGEMVTRTISKDEFIAMMKTALPELKHGLLFIDEDKAEGQVIQVTDKDVHYIKKYGADSWQACISIADFAEKISTYKISLS